jgi:nitrogen fixation protein FixH
MSARAIAADPRKGRWIPWLFIGGFVLVLAVNAVMIALALSSFTGLTTTEPYTKGLRFNEELRQAEEQARLGWRIAGRFEPRGAARGTVELELAGRDGRPLAGAEVVAVFSRPVERGHDFTVALESLGGGRYAAPIAFPLAGVWDVHYRIRYDGHALKARDRLQVN